MKPEDRVRKWLEVGNSNIWIRKATDPPFDERSFYECSDIEELKAKLAHGNWSLGQAFYLEDICFIQQVNGGDEWLVIRGDLPFESITYSAYLKHLGPEALDQFIERVTRATDRQLRRLEYWNGGAETCQNATSAPTTSPPL